MIFITVGSSELPFDRLLRGIERFSGEESLVVQHGPSKVRPPRASCVDFMAFDDVVEHMRAARIVITHAGVGSVMTALAADRRPLVVPRRRQFREAVDDHQIELARRLAGSELVTLVEDPYGLEPVLAALPQKADSLPRTETRLGRELRVYLASCCAAARAGRPFS